MFPEYTLEIDAKELLSRMATGGATAHVEALLAMNDAVAYVQDDAASYPLESDANQPPPPYYIRGTGTQYASGANRGESQQLNQHWETRIERGAESLDGIIEVPPAVVTYAIFVHSPFRQMPFHAARGWRTVDKIAEEALSKIMEFFNAAGARLARFLNGG